MRMFSIASGSSGNCIYVGNEDTHVLVDIGISGKRVIEGLAQINLALHDIDAILITHEHIDHIKGLGVILRKCPIPVYATPKTIDAILQNSCIGKVDKALFGEIVPDHNFSIKTLFVNASSTWHDAADPVCYSFSDSSGKMSVVTDLGDFDDYLIHKLKRSDVMLVESNHDVRMLQANQRYTYALKQRILGKRGHLSNERSGELMVQLTKAYPMKAIVLGHLSNDNNIPECALINMQNYMDSAGINRNDMLIQVAERERYSVDISI